MSAADAFGFIERGRTMRSFLERFQRRAPSLAEHVGTVIKVDLSSGARTVERLATQAAASIDDEVIQQRVKVRTNQLVNEAVEGAARKAAEMRIREIARNMAAGPSVSRIIEAVSLVTEQTTGDLLGPRRARQIVYPRFLLIALMRSLRPDLSLPAIGRALNKDHTTILSALRRFDEMKALPPFSDWLNDARVQSLIDEQRRGGVEHGA